MIVTTNHALQRTAITKIISGGQTGADHTALDWAIAHGIPYGGWCPAGRMAEDGVIPAKYQLTEMPDGGGYRQRNKANVQDSDATLILTISPELSGGSKQTVSFAKHLRKPWLHVHPEMNWQDAITSWLASNQIEILNVAGPRSSKEPDIGVFVMKVLDAIAGSIIGSPAGRGVG